MGSYQTWFGEGPELSVLRMLGLFDRPADEKTIAVLLKPPGIPGLTESLTELNSALSIAAKPGRSFSDFRPLITSSKGVD